MKRLCLSKLAELDLDEVWYEIAKRSGSILIADGVIDSIERGFKAIRLHPEVGRKREDIDSGVRSLSMEKYIVYYRESGRSIEVSRVIHGMRDQKTVYFEGLE